MSPAERQEIDASVKAISARARARTAERIAQFDAAMALTYPLNVGDGHRYDEIWDDKGRRFVCIDCGARLYRDRIVCTRAH